MLGKVTVGFVKTNVEKEGLDGFAIEKANGIEGGILILGQAFMIPELPPELSPAWRHVGGACLDASVSGAAKGESHDLLWIGESKTTVCEAEHSALVSGLTGQEAGATG